MMSGAPPSGQADPQYGEVVTLEYTGSEQGSRSYLGKATSNRYRFGSDQDHRRRLVYKEDVQGFLSLGSFKEVSASTGETPEPLEAKGPPVR
jgi:hypothetical protein